MSNVQPEKAASVGSMKVFTRIATILAVVIAVWLIVRVTSYIARLPESNCVTTPASEYFAPDRAYKATVLEKNCNKGETFFYSVRIDGYPPPLSTAWFIPGFELESDQGGQNRPEVHWAAPRRLEVLVKTHALAGTLTNHVGQDLILVRTYEPSGPKVTREVR
jgi:hypothetical protein